LFAFPSVLNYTEADMKREIKPRKFNRRRFIAALLAGAPLAIVADSFWWEPGWLKVRKLKLADSPKHRFVHFTDLHHKGERDYLQKVVNKINAAAPEFVCFTGDLVEENRFLTEALEILGGIKAPLYGIPGNHDYWASADFGQISRAFARTGGAWLVNDDAPAANGQVHIHGVAQLKHAAVKPRATAQNILLLHYPLWVEVFYDKKFAAILAGHTHGGQVRAPFYGPLIVPFDSGRFDYGLFPTPAGSLYVSSGIGYFYINVRFNCRPEIAVVEI
jgi:predicted MPP superfamily phosphohydrolase